MALSEQLILDTQTAFRELDALQGRLDNLSDIRLDITADTSGLNADLERSRSLVEDTASSFGEVNQQVTLTTDEYKRAVRAIDEGATASRAIAVATGEVADEAASAEDALRRVAETMGISEDEARDLARSMGEATRETANLDADLRQVARSMGLSEDEARQFVQQVRQASGVTSDLEETSSGLRASWTAIAGRAAVVLAGALGLRRVFQSGFERFTTIEDAGRALTVQLGDAAEAGEVLADVLDVVRGTPFNLDQFADASAQLISFGVEAQKIPGILTAIGEAAATRGARAPEFVERLVQLFGQITTAGRLSGEQITRFAETGVNALAILANTFGVTTEEIRDMVSKGLIPADQAIEAITTGIIEGTEGAAGATVALGGTMEGLRETLSGARGGLEAATARFGEKLVDLASPAILAWLQAATTGFDELGGAIAGAGDEAEDARNAFVDFLADLPRGFGAFGDVVTGLGGSFVSLIDSAAALGRADPAAAVDAFEQALRQLDDTTANIAIRVIEQDITDFLRAGGSEIDAFANAIAQLQDKDVLSDATVARFARLTGVDDAQLKEVVRTFAEFGDEAGFTADELLVLRGVLSTLIPSAARREFANFAFGLDETAIAAGIAAREAAEAAEQSERMEEALAALGRISDTTGLSVGFIARNIADFDADLIPLVNDLGAAAIEGEAFARAMGELATAVRFDFGDAVDELDLLITKTNEAGDEVPATVAEMIADLQTQANQLAEFEAVTTILEILGLDSLAADLRQQFATDGPGALEAAERFLSDLPGAEEANRILEEGGNPGQEYIDLIIQAIEDGDLSPAALEAAKGLTSQEVKDAIIRAAIEDGNLFGRELQAALSAFDFSVTIPLVAATAGAGGFGDALDRAGSSTGAAAPSGADQVIVNQTNNFNTTPQPTTDTQRITNSTESAIRNLIR